MGKNAKVMISVQLDGDLANSLDARIEAFCKAERETDRSKFIRDAIRRLLREPFETKPSNK